VSRSVRLAAACAFAVLGCALAAQAQGGAPPPLPPDQPARPEVWTDPLGRSTPRGTVLGFLEAARKADRATAAQYLNTTGGDAEVLAGKLFAVLDARLPARLLRISDAPEGSNPAAPARESVGTIESSTGKVEIVLERIKRRGDPGPVWLFSGETLDLIPAQFEQIGSSRWNAYVPRFLLTIRLGGLRLADLLAILLGLPIVYLVTLLLNRALTPVIRWGFREAGAAPPSVLPTPARLLLVIVAGGWLVATLPFSLAVRQIWSGVAALLTIASVAWLLVLLNGEIERHVYRRLAPSHAPAAGSLLRLGRRGVDLLILFGAVIATLRHFGIDPTPALAGLGVGGIAVALAAQKTLENVIAGASIIFDQAVRVGDFLKMGEVSGTVDHIGLRSTRIRTLDRTVVSVPNSQIANASLETLSARDKFWFHPLIGLRYETTPDQLHLVVDRLRHMLIEHPSVDIESVRVRFIRLGSFSLDVELFAYLLARDWSHFLELQEQLLFDITAIVDRSGTAFAFPSQTTYVASLPETVAISGSSQAH
jgi:MscS family membrane protein